MNEQRETELVCDERRYIVMGKWQRLKAIMWIQLVWNVKAN